MSVFELGDIVFEGSYQPNALSITSEANYAEVSRLGGKPILQRFGSKLDELSLSIRLHSQLVKPETALQALNDARDQGTVMPLITGAGDFLGSFLIVRTSRTSIQHAGDGSIMAVDVDITLKERASTDLATQRSTVARSGAIALASNEPVIATGTSTGSTALEYQASADVLTANSGATAAPGLALKMGVSPNLENQKRRHLIRLMDLVIAKATKARSIVNATTGQIYTDTRDLNTQLGTMITQATSVRTLCLNASASVGSIQAAGDDLAAQVPNVRDAAQLLTRFTATRSAS